MSDEASGAVVKRVREACATELNRLGSEKALVAGTGAVLDAESVLGWAATAAVRGAVVFEGWAADESHGVARAAFEAAATAEREHVARLVELGAIEPAPVPEPEAAAPDPLSDHLRGLQGTVERVGGLIGRSLVVSRGLLQVVNFFVNEADAEATDVARDLRADADARVEEGAALLDDLEGGPEPAVEAATGAIEAAYREYADTLEAMGVDPQPVC